MAESPRTSSPSTTRRRSAGSAKRGSATTAKRRTATTANAPPRPAPHHRQPQRREHQWPQRLGHPRRTTARAAGGRTASTKRRSTAASRRSAAARRTAAARATTNGRVSTNGSGIAAQVAGVAESAVLVPVGAALEAAATASSASIRPWTTPTSAERELNRVRRDVRRFERRGSTARNRVVRQLRTSAATASRACCASAARR